MRSINTSLLKQSAEFQTKKLKTSNEQTNKNVDSHSEVGRPSILIPRSENLNTQFLTNQNEKSPFNEEQKSRLENFIPSKNLDSSPIDSINDGKIKKNLAIAGLQLARTPSVNKYQIALPQLQSDSSIDNLNSIMVDNPPVVLKQHQMPLTAESYRAPISGGFDSARNLKTPQDPCRQFDHEPFDISDGDAPKKSPKNDVIHDKSINSCTNMLINEGNDRNEGALSCNGNVLSTSQQLIFMASPISKAASNNFGYINVTNPVSSN